MMRILGFLLACSLAAPAFAGAPILRTNGERVPGEYIVVFKSPFAMQPTASRMKAMGAEVSSTWDIMSAAYVRMSPEQLAAATQMDGVSYIEEASMYYITAAQNRTIATNQRTGLYGIDSIDGARNGRVTAPGDGTGVDVYVVDTGVQPAHNQFLNTAQTATRLVRGRSFAGDGRTADCNGHGTHVSGTATGRTFGVAVGATLRDVRVFTCSGSTTNQAILDGLNYVLNQASARSTRRAVVNMSLGGGISTALDRLVTTLNQSNIFVAVAAGNSNANAANTSPARSPGAFAVGSSTINMQRSSFSNFGTTVKLFAPGSNVLSSWYRSATDTNTISGTSMASPHVAGAAAIARGLFPNESAATIGNRLVREARTGVLTGGLGTGSPNRFLNINPAR